MPVEINFPGNLAQVDDVATLRQVATFSLPLGTLYIVTEAGSTFEYDPGSVSVDDGVNVVRPNDKTSLQAGRWLFVVNGLGAGPAGATGPADNTYTSLTTLLASDKARKKANLVGDTDVPPAPDGPWNVVDGEWKPQDATGIGFAQPDTGAVQRDASAKLGEAPISPADFGGIQTALNKAVARADVTLGRVPVELVQGTTTAISTTIEFDTLRTSLIGEASIDARAVPIDQPAIRVNCRATSNLGNSYGDKGHLSNFRLFGALAGETRKAGIGIDFNASFSNGSAQVRSDRLTVAGFEIGHRFSARGYNSFFTHGEIFNCGTCILWPVGGVDNGERNTYVSYSLYNSDIGIENNEPSSGLYFESGSIDFTQSIARVNGGKVFLTDSHLESNRWGDLDGYAMKAEGDSGYISVKGGYILNQATTMAGAHFALVGEGARIDLDQFFVNNLPMNRTTPLTPTAWFIGNGIGRLGDFHCFEGTLLPDKIHAGKTWLSDPSFESATWEDLVCISADTAPITDLRTGANLTIDKSTAAPLSGTKSLVLSKVGGPGSLAAAMLPPIPVGPNRKTFAGIYYRLDPTRPGTSGSFNIQWYWGRSTENNENGVPIWSREQLIQIQATVATSAYQMMVFGKAPTTPGVPAPVSLGASGRSAPSWATHFFARVEMFDLGEANLLIDDIWVEGTN